MAVCAAGFVLLAQIGALPFCAVLLGYALFCAGLAPLGTLTTDLVMSSAPPPR